MILYELIDHSRSLDMAGRISVDLGMWRHFRAEA
jgi:hypothetical protein